MSKGTKKGLVVAGVGAVVILGIIFYSEKKANAALPPGPGPSPGPAPGPSPSPSQAPTTPLQVAAYNMNVALESNGYRALDAAIYKAFQSAAGLTADGYPGANTMNALAAAVQSYGDMSPIIDGSTGSPIVVYQWVSGGGWGNGNAPPTSVWCAGTTGTCP